MRYLVALLYHGQNIDLMFRKSMAQRALFSDLIVIFWYVSHDKLEFVEVRSRAVQRVANVTSPRSYFEAKVDERYNVRY